MAQVEFGDLVLGQPWHVDEFGTRWTLTSHTGFRDGPPKKTSYSDRIMDEGSYDGPVFANQRVFVANFTTVSQSEMERDRAIETVRGNTSGELLPVLYTNSLRTLQAMVRETDASTAAPWGVHNCNFSIQLTASNPRMIDVSKGLQLVSTQLAQPAPNGGVQFRGLDGAHGALLRGPDGLSGLPMGVPGPSGIVTLDNTEGRAPASVVFTISGPVDHPTISTTGRKMTFQDVLGPNDRLVIDTGAKTVLFNGGDRSTDLTPAQWFSIPKKSKLAVRFSARQQNAVASMSAAYYVTFY